MMCSLPAGGSHLARHVSLPVYADLHCQSLCTDGAVDLRLRGADPHHQCAPDALAAENYWVRGKELLTCCAYAQCAHLWTVACQYLLQHDDR
jgi:hypothetical protein